MKTLNAIITLMRPHQWVKNVFLLAPLFFTPAIWNGENLILLMQGFFTFSLLASTIYIFNDLNDVAADRAHPVKKKRPIAAKLITEQAAANAMIALGCITAAFAWFTSADPLWMALLGLYLIINAFYSLYLKHMPLLDVAIVAAGFVIRILAGCALVGLTASSWILICTFFLALFLAFGKRRDDLTKVSNAAKKRPSLRGYNLAFVEGAMVLLAGLSILSYTLYTISPEVIVRLGTDQMFWSAAIVTFGFLRYLQISFVEDKAGSPTMVVLTDKSMQIILLTWLLTCAWLIYGN